MSAHLACTRHADLAIATTEGKGRSVFATAAIAHDTVLEISPALRFSEEDAKRIEATGIEDYVFKWEEDGFSTAVVFGMTSLVNHSANPNATFSLNITDHTATLRAKRGIAAGEEITMDYGVSLWFEAKE